MGPALKKSSFEVDDLDRSLGKYYVRFVEPEDADKDGWFSWLFSSDSDSVDLTGNSYLITVVSTQGDDSVTITMGSPEGGELAWGEAEKLLSIIKSNLN